MKAIFPDLEGKRILITGASRGIGREIALNLAKQKAHIIFNYRKSEEEANKLKEELIQAGAVDVTALQFDINDSDSYQDKLTNFIKETGAIEGLVNNAGVSKDQLTLRIKKEDLDFVLDTNLKSTMMLTNFLSKNFLKRNFYSKEGENKISLFSNFLSILFTTNFKFLFIDFTGFFGILIWNDNCCSAVALNFSIQVAYADIFTVAEQIHH